MNFSLRQWAIIAGLAAAFIAVAVLVSKSGGDTAAISDEPAAFDEVVWCENANAISRWSSVLDGSADGDTLDDVRNLRQSLADGRPTAPMELGFEIARLQDYALIIEQEAERAGSLAGGLEGAQGNVDTDRVATAIDAVNAAIVACGHPPIAG